MRVAQSNPYSCLAAVAAMIAGVSLAEVFEHIGHDGSGLDVDSPFEDGRRPIRLTEIAEYLAGQGFLLGACAEELPVSAYLLASRQIFDIKATICGHAPALLIVEGVNFKHAVFWTGRHVLDPRPDRQGTYDLDDYRILQWWPVVRVA